MTTVTEEKPKPKRRRHQFQKGNQYGKLGGRPRKDPDLITQCKALTSLCVKNLAEILLNKKARATDKLSAAALVLGYAAGKPRLTADINVEYSITDDFLNALREINEQAGVAGKSEPKTIEAKPEPMNGKMRNNKIWRA